MKKIAMALIVAACVAAVFAEETNAPAATPAATKRVRRPRRPSAGILERPEAVPSRQIGVYNQQKQVADATVAAAVLAARRQSSLPLLKDAQKAPARIDIVERDCPSALVLYPEQMKAEINVKALAADGAAPAAVAKRLQLELSRAALYVLGSGMVSYQCLTKSIRSLPELDALSNATLSAEAITHLGAGRALGVEMIRYTSYERACQEGWAPAPTNEIQKQVWDRVHELPKNPLKLEK